jgi:citronellol/citronellal dehydrogenase
MNLAGKTLFITGASRGIGLAIGLRAARDGANVAVAAKTIDPHPGLEGTIHTAAAAIERAGGRALALQVDVRCEASVESGLAAAAQAFGGIDILVNNAGAIALTNTVMTQMHHYDLLQAVNVRGTFLCTRLAIPYLRTARNAHILNIAPPLELDARWFAPHAAFTIAKFGMSLCTLAHSQEFKDLGIAVNSLWPLTTIDSAPVVGLGDRPGRSRSPRIMADAAHVILTSQAKRLTGHYLVDEEVLRDVGHLDFSMYDSPGSGPFAQDLFIPAAVLRRIHGRTDLVPGTSSCLMHEYASD